ncbi:MAG TPA: hypothetical protein DC054_09350 [Blastocatellia bacterium]|nr:hypothetical protein [Blastocatellia bacterium]
MIFLNLKSYGFQNNEGRPLRDRSKILRIVGRVALEIWALMLSAACLLLLYCIYAFSNAYFHKGDHLSEFMPRKPDWSAEFAGIWITSLMSLALVGVLPFVTAWIKSTRMLAQRLTKVDAQLVLTQDTRAPIFYLRSFLDRYSGNDILAQSESDENMIFPVLNEVGPVIALGQPGETLPPLGATRLYLEKDSDWQTTVTDYLSRSRLVVISPGHSDGVIWETSKAFQLGQHEKVIISLISFWSEMDYSKNHNEYQRFIEAIGINTNFELPKGIDGSLFMYFDAARNARIVKVGASMTSPWLATVAVRKVLTRSLLLILGVVPGWEHVLPLGVQARMASRETNLASARPAEITVRKSLQRLLLTKGIKVRKRMPFGWYLSKIYEFILVSVALLIPILSVIRVVLRWLS